MTRTLRHFRFWCQSVLPLVYDDSLSYYEVVCKCVTYINELIDSDKEIVKNLDGIESDVREIQEWIDNYDTTAIEQFISEYLAIGVYFGLTDDGYFVAYIPETWDEITFETTGYDVDLAIMPEFGHLCLDY